MKSRRRSLPSQGKVSCTRMFRDCDFTLGCGPVLNIKNGGSRKEEYVLFSTKYRQRKSVCA